MKSHPNSLANLRPNLLGSKPRYNETKKRRHLTVTETGWKAVKEKAKQEFGISVSEMLELIGRGEVTLTRTK